MPLALVAGHTERIGLGTATICAPFTAPSLLAEPASTLGVLTGGRLTLGPGIGWRPHDYATAGVPFERRGRHGSRSTHCLHALWTQDPVEFSGEFHTVPRSQLGLATVQRPHPPVLLGGSAPAALRRAGRLAEGWISRALRTSPASHRRWRWFAPPRPRPGRDPDAVRILGRGVVDLLDAFAPAAPVP